MQDREDDFLIPVIMRMRISPRLVITPRACGRECAIPMLVSFPDPTSREEKGLVNLDRFLGLAGPEGARRQNCAKANL